MQAQQRHPRSACADASAILRALLAQRIENSRRPGQRFGQKRTQPFWRQGTGCRPRDPLGSEQRQAIGPSATVLDAIDTRDGTSRS
jgi:hypothetical protein